MKTTILIAALMFGAAGCSASFSAGTKPGSTNEPDANARGSEDMGKPIGAADDDGNDPFRRADAPKLAANDIDSKSAAEDDREPSKSERGDCVPGKAKGHTKGKAQGEAKGHDRPPCDASSHDAEDSGRKSEPEASKSGARSKSEPKAKSKDSKPDDEASPTAHEASAKPKK